MAMDHANAKPSWQKAERMLEIFFTSAFAVEAAMKLVAYYPTLYFKNKWNRFDFAIVVGALIGMSFSSTIDVQVSASNMEIL